MIRVLHVFGGLGAGGTESLIMNWYRNIDRSKIQFDFLVRSDDSNYVKEIEGLGGRVFYTSSFPRHFLKNYRETCDILKRKEWDVIHVHGNAAMYILPLKLAKDYGYKVRIMHSHNVKTQNVFYEIIHKINKRRINSYATHKLSCSESAGKWMFNDDWQIARNAINVDDYLYNNGEREKCRKQYNLTEKFVVGHVGRFSKQKNHFFLLEIFREILKINPESVLVLAGDGELLEEVKEKTVKLGISDSVLLLGRRNDVEKIMSAMDCFVLPSLYEGLGIVLVEAQMNGLPCYVSEEAYNEEVKITTSVDIISLKQSANEWAKRIIHNAHNQHSRLVNRELLEKSGYDITEEVKHLERLYQSSKE